MLISCNMSLGDCSDFDNSLQKKGNIQSETDSQFKHAFHRMDSMRERGLFCDVVLATRNVEISAHKVVLASSSEFFESSFVKMGEEKFLSLEQIDGKTLSVLVDYIYTSCIEIKINVTSVEDILIGANILQLKNIKKECCKYLENNLNLNTSLTILSIARNQKYMDLLKKTEDFIDQNIVEIMKTQEFLKLPFDQLTHLIIRDTLEVPSEEKIYEGVISWVKHDLTTRTKHLSVLMSHVRLSLISNNYLAKYVIDEPLFKTDIQCKDLIIKAVLWESIPQMIKPNARKRFQILLVMGGGNEAKKTFEMYDFKANNWSKTYPISREIHQCNLAFVNQKLYVTNYIDITEYDMVNNRWYNPIKMNSSRGGFGVGVLNDCIYIVGGYHTITGLTMSSVEKFDISSQKWSSIAPMSIERYDVGVGILDGFLYVVGGESKDLLKSVEFYDPKLNVWKQISYLTTARSKAAIGVLHNKIYVIGGRDGRKVLNSVECYLPVTNRFTESAPLNIPRSSSAVVTFDDKLYVIGGYDGTRYLNNIEVYCPKNDKWELLPTTMNVARCAPGAVIIDKVIDF